MPAVNHIRTAKGLVSAVCQFCAKRGKAVKPDKDGEPCLFAMPNGWTQAPYPAHLEHKDGSRGSFYTCPTCSKRLHRGQKLLRRGEGATVRNVR